MFFQKKNQQAILFFMESKVLINKHKKRLARIKKMNNGVTDDNGYDNDDDGDEDGDDGAYVHTKTRIYKKKTPDNSYASP
jgi:hypothetical protein